MKIPVALFLIALGLDHYFTQSGLAHGFSEGNIIVVWLWSVVPGGHTLLTVWWALFILIVTGLLRYFRSPQVALWILYTAFAAHMIGFLSWTPILGDAVPMILATLGHRFGLALLLFCAMGIGATLTYFHERMESATASW